MRPGEFWALEDVSFSLGQGQALGLIGANGAGKTTLFRIIGGLILPDRGTVSVNGRLAPLIALGAGFNPLLTGRENVRVNLTILGMTQRAINRHFDEILEFAEIEHAIDSPLRTYSSGMAARLGFACAIHTQPDLLLVDEVLAVGDVRFRLKCYQKLASLREQGTSIVLVTHNANAMLNACERSLYLRNGCSVFEGKTADALAMYFDDLSPSGESSATGRDYGTKHVSRISLLDSNNNETEYGITGQDLQLCLHCTTDQELAVNFAILIRDRVGEGTPVLDIQSAFDGETVTMPPGESEVRVLLPCLGLKPGRYQTKITVTQSALSFLDIVEDFPLEVRGSADANVVMGTSQYFQPRSWLTMPRT